jgi:hypothetical protein
VSIVYPALELLDGLVLVKAWTVVERRPVAGADSANRLMEVHGEPVLLHHPRWQPTIPLVEAMATVRAHYAICDPPMYAGWKTWESLKTDPHQEESTAMAKTPRGASKKRKLHVVLGRIASVSPISVQEDSASSHFFMEIEHTEEQRGSRSIVNILLAGLSAIKWHPFLWPGLFVLVTNLKKVYSSESEMFLLQTQVIDGAVEGNSRIFVWRMFSAIPRPHVNHAAPLIHPLCSSAIVNLEGVVTSVVWDDCLMLETEYPVLVVLFHFPWSELRDYVRAGSRVHVYHAHVLHQSFLTQQLRVGLCSRSHIRVAGHAPPTSEASTHHHGDQHRRRLRKKWSLFGDFTRQSLTVSMWWLDLFEVLVQKFRFHTDMPSGLRGGAFVCVRRREATLALGQDVLSASSDQAVATHSLARRFLNAHDQDDRDCPSVVTKRTCIPDFIRMRVLTLADIESSIRKLAHAKIVAAADLDEQVTWPIQIQDHELSEICAVGVLRGCNGASDVDMMDQSASIPVTLDHGAPTCVSIDNGCSVYAFRKFGALVELCEDKTEKGQEQTLVVSLCVTIDYVQRVALCMNRHGDHKIDANGEKRCRLVVFVTHIGPWKRRRRMQTVVGDVRHIRGVGFRLVSESDSRVNWDSAHQVELLLSTECESWFVDMHSWYKFEGVRENASSQTTAGEAALVHHWLKMRANTDAHQRGDTVASARGVNETPRAGESNGGETEPCESASYIADGSSVVLPVGLHSPRPSLVEVGVAIAVDEDTRCCVLAMEERALQLRAVSHVHDLFVINLSEREDEAGDMTPASRADPHAARLINLVGVVKERHLYIKHGVPVSKSHDPLHGESREQRGTNSSRICRLKIRSMLSLETVSITVDTDLFGTMSSLQPGTVVEISMIQCFVARASFKPFLTWTHCTTARRVDDPTMEVVSDGHIVSEMATTHLNALYENRCINRTIRRFAVRLAHLSYAVLKRRCSQCKQPLTLLKRQQAWVHTTALSEEGASSNQRSCPWKQIAQDSPLFHQRTFLSCSLRGIIDDGSAQAELFLENDIVWELLRCSRGQRQRFEGLLTRQTSDLSYFAARSNGAGLFTSPSMQENLYYQNEWRAFVQATVTALGAFVVYAQRFYKPPVANAAPPTAVLTFGKDIQITTPSVPLLQLEAMRLDELNPRNELRRRLAMGQNLGRG